MDSFVAVIEPAVPQKCLAAQGTNWMTFTISLGLAFGIVLSYLPQVDFPTMAPKLILALPHNPEEE